MALEELVKIVHDNSISGSWPVANDLAFKAFFGSRGGRYSAAAAKAVSLRNPEFKNETGVSYAAYIHPENPNSGPYSGMSIAIFPAENAPCLLSFVIGTQGLSPDEEVLGRPGHARKVQAICAWLNQKHGHGRLVAWAKEDPVRTEMDIPAHIARQFPAYQPAYVKYGKLLYGIFVPTEDRVATREAITAFLDLMFEERGHRPLADAQGESDLIRAEWFQYLVPDTTLEQVHSLLQDRRYVIVQGPPGTGKTRMASLLLERQYHGRGFPVQFHPNTTYETFLGGLAPVHSTESLGLRFAPQLGHLMQAAEQAAQKPQEPFLLHIDEINRADLSKVLGEAIYLLEAGESKHRKINLPYDFGQPFGRNLELPPNLHILGTMNSSDRSIAIVDVAVRRRFAFVKLWPQLRVVKENGCSLMEKAFVDLMSIFVEHASRDAFDLVPGHSYFLEKDETKAKRRLKTSLAPLLEEYLAQGYVAGFSEPIRSYLQWVESL